MAKQIILKERCTDEILYPLTLASLVQTANGDNVDEAIDKAKIALFIDMFNSAAGDYGYARISNGTFDCRLNDIPLTYEEAIEIYALYSLCKSRQTDRRTLFADVKVKTLFPINAHSWYSPAEYLEAFRDNTSLIAVRFLTDMNGPYVNMSSYRAIFSGCRCLRYVYGILLFGTADGYGVFDNCIVLEEVQIKNLRVSISFSKSSKLSLNSVNFMIANATNTSPITITVHPDVYNKLTDETNVEWNLVLIDATAKNISFATT